jgi:hypothetical protein
LGELRGYSEDRRNHGVEAFGENGNRNSRKGATAQKAIFAALHLGIS